MELKRNKIYLKHGSNYTSGFTVDKGGLIPIANKVAIWDIMTGTPDINYTSHSDMTVSATQIERTGGGGSFDAGSYSNESYEGGCYLQFQMGVVDKIATIGLNTDPATSYNETDIDYGIRFLNPNSAGIKFTESGTKTNDTGTIPAITDKFGIYYDGTDNIYYYHNTTQLRTVSGVGAGVEFYVDSSFKSLNSIIHNIYFMPVNPVMMQFLNSVSP